MTEKTPDFIPGEKWKIRLQDGSVYTGAITRVSLKQISLKTTRGEKILVSITDIARAKSIDTETGSGRNAKAW